MLDVGSSDAAQLEICWPEYVVQIGHVEADAEQVLAASPHGTQCCPFAPNAAAQSEALLPVLELHWGHDPPLEHVLALS